MMAVLVVRGGREKACCPSVNTSNTHKLYQYHARNALPRVGRWGCCALLGMHADAYSTITHKPCAKLTERGRCRMWHRRHKLEMLLLRALDGSESPFLTTDDGVLYQSVRWGSRL